MLLSRSNVGSTVHDDIASYLTGSVDEMTMQRDFLPDVPNAKAYPVDFHLEGKDDVSLLVYGVLNRDKAPLANDMLGNFHRHHPDFESVVVFQDQTGVPRVDLARLSDVDRDMVSSLESPGDLSRKVMR